MVACGALPEPFGSAEVAPLPGFGVSPKNPFSSFARLRRPVKNDGNRGQKPHPEKVPSGEVKWEEAPSPPPRLLHYREGTQSYNLPDNKLWAALQRDYHQILVLGY